MVGRSWCVHTYNFLLGIKFMITVYGFLSNCNNVDCPYKMARDFFGRDLIIYRILDGVSIIPIELAWDLSMNLIGPFFCFCFFVFESVCHLLVIFHPKKRTIWNLRARHCMYLWNKPCYTWDHLCWDIVLIIIIEYSSFKGFCERKNGELARFQKIKF